MSLLTGRRAELAVTYAVVLLQYAVEDVGNKLAGKGILSPEVLRILWVLRGTFAKAQLKRRLVFVQLQFSARPDSTGQFNSRQVF